MDNNEYYETIGKLLNEKYMHKALNDLVSAVTKRIEKMEYELAELKAEKRAEWIPCSERLPKEETDVLVTRTFLGCKDGSHGWNHHIPQTTYVEVAQYFNGEWSALSDEYKVARSRHTNPVAWVPLPEPYKGGEGE